MASGYLEAEEAEGKELVQMRKQAARRRESFIEPELGRSTAARKFFNLAAAQKITSMYLLGLCWLNPSPSTS
jgi:hypothetical protein